MSRSLKVKILSGFFERLRGLEFREADESNYLFKNCNSIHTFGMKGPIDVAFVGADGEVLSVSRSVQAGKVLRNRNAKFAIERFASEKPWVEVGLKYTFKEER